MKNIEKYTNTKDALEAYNSLDSKMVSFDTWLECEFEEPRVPTLLEAADDMVYAWKSEFKPRGSCASTKSRMRRHWWRRRMRRQRRGFCTFPVIHSPSPQRQSAISTPPLSAGSLSRARSVARKSYAAHNRACRAVEVVKKGDMK